MCEKEEDMIRYSLNNNRNDEVAVDYVNQIDYDDMVTPLLPLGCNSYFHSDADMILHYIDLEVDYLYIVAVECSIVVVSEVA